MEALKKYLFWIVLAVVVIGSVGSYFFFAGDVEAEITRLDTDTKSKMATVTKLYNDRDKIENQTYVDAAREFEKHLKRQEDDILKAWADKGLVLDEEYKNAPTNLLDFDNIWVTGKRNDILKKAKAAGLSLPKDFETTALYQTMTTGDQDMRKLRIRNISLIGEIIDILTSTRAEVTGPKFTGEPNDQNPNTAEQVEKRMRGAVSLDDLAIIETKDAALREKAAYEAGVRAGGGNMETGGREAPPSPYNSLQVELRFTTVFPAVPQTLQKFESSKLWFGIIRKLDTQRMAKVYADPSEFGLFNPVKKEEPKEGDAPVAKADVTHFNTHYDEGPVQVLTVIDLLTFNKDAMAAKPPVAGTPPKAK